MADSPIHGARLLHLSEARLTRPLTPYELAALLGLPRVTGGRRVVRYLMRYHPEALKVSGEMQGRRYMITLASLRKVAPEFFDPVLDVAGALEDREDALDAAVAELRRKMQDVIEAQKNLGWRLSRIEKKAG